MNEISLSDTARGESRLRDSFFVQSFTKKVDKSTKISL